MTRTVLITGTSSGLGLALSVRMARSGWKVWATMRNPDKSVPLKEAAAAAGVSDLIFVDQMDVTNCDSVNSSVERMEKLVGPASILVNNAGYCLFGSIEMLSINQVKDQMDTNFYGPIRCTKAVMPSMRAAKHGKIINISSVGGVWGQPFNDVYCASKFALEGLSESQAPLYREFGVYVTSLQPGGIKSAFVNNAEKPDMAAMPPDYHGPLGKTFAGYERWGADGTSQTPDEVAEVIMTCVVDVDAPPLCIQPNAGIQAIFEMQMRDTTGETGVKSAIGRFLS